MSAFTTMYRPQNLAKGDSMTELELTRTSGDRRLYSLEGIGTVRLEGLFSHSATAEAGERGWRFTRRGFWQRVMEATDAAGVVVGASSCHATSGEAARSAGAVAT